MQEQMLVNRDKDLMFESADVDKLSDLKNRLDKTERRNSIHQILLAILGALPAGALFLLVRFNRNVIFKYYHKKVLYFARRFGAQTPEQAPAFPKDEQLSDEEIFNLFNAKVRQERHFLNYQLGRDDYTRIMQVDKNRFAAIIRTYTGDDMSACLHQ